MPENHLSSKEDIQRWLNDCRSVGIESDMARQLIAALEENERLLEEIERLTRP